MRMTIGQISSILGTTPQYVDMVIKRALGKVYRSTSRLNPELSPFELIILIAEMCNVKMLGDFERFFTDFPKSVRKIVMADAMKRIRLIDPDATLDDLIDHNSRATKRKFIDETAVA